MRTLLEIKNKIEEGFDQDFFGWGIDDIRCALPFEELKDKFTEEFLSKENAKEEWESSRLKTDEDVKAKMLEYLPFAWEKANDERGLSADRSIRHFAAWAWLIDDSLYEKIEEMYNSNYVPYGTPILKYISGYLGYVKES